MPDHHIILASASPRRAELLRQIGVEFSVHPTNIDETARAAESAENYVRRLAIEKARAADLPNAIVIGSDTAVVAPNGEVLGKPQNKADGLRMLSLLAGREHQVLTSVALVRGENIQASVCASFVQFRSVSNAEMLAYWRSGEPLGKAGGYAIQGLAAVFVNHLRGSYSAVMGLPLAETAALLKSAGVNVLDGY